MDPETGEPYSVAGCLNLIGGFWRQVLADLHPERDTPRTRLTRRVTEAWLEGTDGFVPDFVSWCGLGGTDLDPEAWRDILRSGAAVRLLPASGE